MTPNFFFGHLSARYHQHEQKKKKSLFLPITNLGKFLVAEIEERN